MNGGVEGGDELFLNRMSDMITRRSTMIGGGNSDAISEEVSFSSEHLESEDAQNNVKVEELKPDEDVPEQEDSNEDDEVVEVAAAVEQEQEKQIQAVPVI